MTVTFKVLKETLPTHTHRYPHTHTIHTLEVCQVGIMSVFPAFGCWGIIKHGGERTLKFFLNIDSVLITLINAIN